MLRDAVPVAVIGPAEVAVLTRMNVNAPDPEQSSVHPATLSGAANQRSSSAMRIARASMRPSTCSASPKRAVIGPSNG